MPIIRGGCCTRCNTAPCLCPRAPRPGPPEMDLDDLMRRPQPQYEALEHLAIVMCASFEKVLLSASIDLSAETKSEMIDKLREVRDEVAEAIHSYASRKK